MKALLLVLGMVGWLTAIAGFFVEGASESRWKQYDQASDGSPLEELVEYPGRRRAARWLSLVGATVGFVATMTAVVID